MTTPDLIARLRSLVDDRMNMTGTEMLAAILSTLEASDADTVRVRALESAITQALSCTPSIEYAHTAEATIVYDCGDPWEILRDALTASHPKPEPCPSCGGLNTSCPDGCGRDPTTGDLDGSTLKPEPVETQPDMAGYMEWADEKVENGKAQPVAGGGE